MTFILISIFNKKSAILIIHINNYDSFSKRN